MMWIPIWATGVINGLAHWWGYRNFEAEDASTNVSPWGIIVGGEELHNNHHTYPTSAKFSVKKYEFDIGWVYISLMQKIGWAKVQKLPPKMQLGDVVPVAKAGGRSKRAAATRGATKQSSRPLPAKPAVAVKSQRAG